MIRNIFSMRSSNYSFTRKAQNKSIINLLNLGANGINKIKFNKFTNFYFNTKLNNNNLKFFPFCQIINALEKESSYLKKQEIFVNYLMQTINSESNKCKSEVFEDIGNIIKLTVPTLFIVEENENNKTTKGEAIRNQYNYQNILERFAKESLFNQNGEAALNIKILAKNSGGIYNLISESFQIPLANKNSKLSLLNVIDIISYKSEFNLATGNNSSEAKINLFKEILSKCCDKLEVYYISRLFTNQMSCGMSTKSIIKCLTLMEKQLKTNKTNKEFFKDLVEFLEQNIFKYSIGLSSNSESDANLENNQSSYAQNKENAGLKIGKYVDLCLCRPGVNLEALLKMLKDKKQEKVLVEIKFDGERSQIHFDENTLKMGSRKFENQVNLYKNLYENIMKNITEFNENNKESEIKNFILDGEIICYVENDVKEKNQTPIKILDFQELRKKKENEKFSEIKYVFVAFDILVYNDIQVFKMPMEKRKELLKKIFQKKLNSITVENGEIIKYIDDKILTEKIREYYNYAKDINCEGLIVKFLGSDTQYEFGKRKWLKVNLKIFFVKKIPFSFIEIIFNHKNLII